MKIELDLKDLAKYPFLKESQDFMGTFSLQAFLESDIGKNALERAVERVIAALAPRQEGDESSSVSSDEMSVRREVAAYALARVLVSCSGDRFLMDRLARYEASRAAAFLELDEAVGRGRSAPGVRDYVAGSLGLDLNATDMPVTQYVELVPPLRDDRWRLVNRDVHHGRVHLESGDIEILLRERIFSLIRRQLPLRVPDTLCASLAPQLSRITAANQQQLLREFGDVDEGVFPPCMKALMHAITTGANLPHTGRFALTAFLHTIGMSTPQIVEIYCRAPDFDLQKTQYQVEHISGRSGTEYTPPSCATMRTYGICVARDDLCGHVNHPLTYYKVRKKERKETDQAAL
ncbi:MAG: DNA primase large subunit PriL [Methanomicrobiales archaeon]|nr:DNA primase large subunit PriL [Methanomicrobiales archaeon]MDI6876411.1 DNA primase large subunit PriL [Methanomicrobiales archaeon]